MCVCVCLLEIWMENRDCKFVVLLISYNFLLSFMLTSIRLLFIHTIHIAWCSSKHTLCLYQCIFFRFQCNSVKFSFFFFCSYFWFERCFFHSIVSLAKFVDTFSLFNSFLYFVFPLMLILFFFELYQVLTLDLNLFGRNTNFNSWTMRLPQQQKTVMSTLSMHWLNLYTWSFWINWCRYHFKLYLPCKIICLVAYSNIEKKVMQFKTRKR